MNQLVDPQDHQKRTTVFAKTPETILVKLYGIAAIPGLEFKRRNDVKLDNQHAKEAMDRGLDPKGYRRTTHPEQNCKADTGFAKFQNESGVRVDTLLEQLKAAGYRFIGGHCYHAGDKERPVSVLEFSLKGQEQPLPEVAVEIMKTQRIGVAHVWCNLRNNTDGKGQYRLDTINLNQPHVPSKKKRENSRRLQLKGNTYELVPYPAPEPTDSTASNEAPTATA